MIDRDLIQRVAQMYVEGRFHFPTPEYWMHLDVPVEQAVVGASIRLDGKIGLCLTIRTVMSDSPSCIGWVILNRYDEVVWGYPLLSQERPDETPTKAFDRWYKDNPEYSRELGATRAVLVTTCVVDGTFAEVKQWLSQHADRGNRYATEVLEGEYARELLQGRGLERFWHFPNRLLQKQEP